MQSVIQITLDWLIEHKVFACITSLRNFKSILGPVPLGRQNNFRFWSTCVCGLYKLQPSTHHLLLLSLPLLLNLLPKFVQLILSGEERLKTQTYTLEMFESLTFPKHIVCLPAWICGFGVWLWCGVPAGCIQRHFWKQSCRFHRRA